MAIFNSYVSLPEGQNPGKKHEKTTGFSGVTRVFQKETAGHPQDGLPEEFELHPGKLLWRARPGDPAVGRPFLGDLKPRWFDVENSTSKILQKFTRNSGSPTFHSSPSHISQLNCQIFPLSLVDPFSKRLPVIFLGRDWQLPQERHICGVPDDTIWTSWMISMMIITGWW